jgi:hypothetical protein
VFYKKPSNLGWQHRRPKKSRQHSRSRRKSDSSSNERRSERGWRGECEKVK